MVNKIIETLNLEGALDNLATIAAIDMESPPPIGVLGKNQIVTSEEALSEGGIQWLSGEGPEPLLEILDLTYQTVLNELYRHANSDWEHRESLRAAMALVGESAKILNQYLVYRFDKPLDQKIEDRAPYRALQEFYKQNFEGEESPFSPPKGTGFKDFEVVKRDTEYELFYIRSEEGEPYFDAEILRNIKLTVDFQTEDTTFEEDPLLKVRAMQDRDLHAGAGHILLSCQHLIADFYRNYKKMQNNELAYKLGMAVIALFLANNARYLLQNTTGKSCLHYYDDFLKFLRSAMQTPEYQKLIAYPPDASNKTATSLLHFAHSLCRSFFLRPTGIMQEAIGLIHRSMRRGDELSKKAIKGDTLWNQFQIEDEKLRTLLAKFPNGPLFKVLDLIRLEQEEDTHIAFDPIGQENLPSHLFDFTTGEKKIEILRIPSPTRQAFIHKAEIIDEFRGFLRGIAGEKRHLLVNLQDRDSWKEGVRCRILEGLQKRVEFASQLSVITLPKDNDFYHQKEAYLEMNNTAEFLTAYQYKLENPEQNGFFLPRLEKSVDWEKFLKMIHKAFFKDQPQLTRENRQDFIEISYQLILLLCIEEWKVDSISFTCKDAIDVGSAEAALFYGFIRLISGDFSKKEDQDFLRYLLYTPALFLRERAIDAERLNRTLSCLEKFDIELSERGKSILKELGEFYSKISSLKLEK